MSFMVPWGRALQVRPCDGPRRGGLALMLYSCFRVVVFLRRFIFVFVAFVRERLLPLGPYRETAASLSMIDLRLALHSLCP